MNPQLAQLLNLIQSLTPELLTELELHLPGLAPHNLIPQQLAHIQQILNNPN